MDQLEASASEPKEEEIQDYLSVANEFDNSACIPKSICEILARGNRTTNQFENQILEYYRYNYKSLIKYLCVILLMTSYTNITRFYSFVLILYFELMSN